MRVFFRRTLFVLRLAILPACAQIGVPVENQSKTGYLDEELSVTPTRLRTDIEKYLRARNLFESVHHDSAGNAYIHQNWVQSPSIRYYQLDFDRRKRHLSEWKAVWYLEPAKKQKATKVRLAILELLYLGDPKTKVRAPKEPDGNWVETDFDQERAILLLADFKEWSQSGQLSKPALFLKTEDLKFPPKSLSEIHRSPSYIKVPWWF